MLILYSTWHGHGFACRSQAGIDMYEVVWCACVIYSLGHNALMQKVKTTRGSLGSKGAPPWNKSKVWLQTKSAFVKIHWFV